MSTTIQTAATEAKPKRAARKSRKMRARSIVSKAKKSGKGLIGQILALHKAGFSRSEIIERGYNKNTVHRQVHEYEMA